MSGSNPYGLTPDDNPGDTPREGSRPEPRAGQIPPYGFPAGAGAYPGGSDELSRAAGPDAPPSILQAVRLMYLGACLSALSVVLGLFQLGSVREEIERQAVANDLSSSSLTTEQVVDGAVQITVGVIVVGGLISVALWLWMAAKNKAGRSWARIVATVLGGLNILSFVGSLSTSGTPLTSVLIGVANLVLAASILYLLYRPASSAYYMAHSAPR